MLQEITKETDTEGGKMQSRIWEEETQRTEIPMVLQVSIFSFLKGAECSTEILVNGQITKSLGLDSQVLQYPIPRHPAVQWNLWPRVWHLGFPCIRRIRYLQKGFTGAIRVSRESCLS